MHLNLLKIFLKDLTVRVSLSPVNSTTKFKRMARYVNHGNLSMKFQEYSNLGPCHLSDLPSLIGKAANVTHQFC